MKILLVARKFSSLVVVSTLHCPVNRQFAGFHDFAADDHLIEDLIDFVEVEDEVKLADTSEVLVQNFHKQVDEFKHGQLIVFRIDTQSEKQPRVSPIYNLMVSILRACKNKEG